MINVETEKSPACILTWCGTFHRVPPSLVTATNSDKQSPLAHRQPQGTIGSAARASHLSPRPSSRGRRLFWVEFELVCRRQGVTHGQCSATQQRDGNRKQDESLRLGRRGVDDTCVNVLWSQWGWFFNGIIKKEIYCHWFEVKQVKRSEFLCVSLSVRMLIV